LCNSPQARQFPHRQTITMKPILPHLHRATLPLPELSTFSGSDWITLSPIEIDTRPIQLLHRICTITYIHPR